MSDVLFRLTAGLESRYRIARQIGVGGMATVYLAHDLRHQRGFRHSERRIDGSVHS